MPKTIYCSFCSEKMSHVAHACPGCGEKPPAQRTEKRDRLMAALFAFFLGAFGGHKFYLGKNGLGVLYLLFFWTFIPYVVSVIEFILLLNMTDEAFHKKYNQLD